MTKVYIINKLDYNKIKDKYLPINILNNIKHYKEIYKYQSSFVAWYNLYVILKKEYNIDLNIIEVKFNDYHKPFIDNIHFNISHSEELIAICISDEECGIDIEMVNKEKNVKLISKELDIDTNNIDYFFKQWTKIEALFKCNGTGMLRSYLKNIDASKVYTTEIFDENNNKYYLSVKTRNDDSNIFIYNEHRKIF